MYLTTSTSYFGN